MNSSFLTIASTSGLLGLCLLLLTPIYSFDVPTNNVRIFHPSFLLKLKDPVSPDEIKKLTAIRDKLQVNANAKIELPDNDLLKRLPVSHVMSSVINNVSLFFTVEILNKLILCTCTLN